MIQIILICDSKKDQSFNKSKKIYKIMSKLKQHLDKEGIKYLNFKIQNYQLIKISLSQ